MLDICFSNRLEIPGPGSLYQKINRNIPYECLLTTIKNSIAHNAFSNFQKN